VQPVSYPVHTAAVDLLACLQAFAAERSNPVLALLGTERQLVAGRKYPQPPLQFGAGQWRAYYHHHHGQPLVAGEHGHFHVFVRAPASRSGGEQARPWAHLAGLGMDSLGQPLRWFAVNAWVTDDAWLPGRWLMARLAQLTPDTEDELLPAWLSAMLCLYREALVSLLDERDGALAATAGGRALEEVQADRSLYQLAARPVDLQHRLEAVLSATPLAGRQ
jgi:hypothetical protein